MIPETPPPRPHRLRDKFAIAGAFLSVVVLGILIAHPPESLRGSHSGSSDPIRPSRDGAVAQVKEWIESHAAQPSVVKYHQWFNDRRHGNHFTAVACTLKNDTGSLTPAQLLFLLDAESGHIQAVMDLESGGMIPP